MNSAEYVKKVRKALGLNVKDFGALVYKSGRTIENYEQGRRVPDKLTMSVIEKLEEDTK